MGCFKRIKVRAGITENLGREANIKYIRKDEGRVDDYIVDCFDVQPLDRNRQERRKKRTGEPGRCVQEVDFS